MALNAVAIVENNSATNATLGQASGGNYGVSLYPGSSGDLTMTNLTGMGTYFEIIANSGDITITDAVGYESIGIDYLHGSGTSTITDFYHFRAGTHSKTNLTLTNNYAFYSEDADALSAIGKLISYREKINALTSSSTITVDCSLAPVHTVTLATNTEFNITNLGTGQSVTIIITQDGTGSRTADWGTSGSTAVSFPGGAPALSTTGGAIDAITIFNDSTNYLGNIAKAYAA
jgi:hypothetical protein